jgi:sporulation protein YlmC with PRC-barrel domain
MTRKSADSSKYWSPKEFVGRTVFDSKGQDCGKIQSLHIDPETFSISGIMVKKRPTQEYFLSRQYFDQINEMGLHLNSIPIKPDDKVIDTEGNKVGKVIKVCLNSDTNKLEFLEVKSGFKTKYIASDKIVGIGEKITIKNY